MPNILKQDKLFEAAEKGDKEKLSSLIKDGVDINARDLSNRTALHWAASEGHTEALELLLESGADVNSVDNFGETALHLAASEGHTRAIEILLENSADVNSVEEFKATALHLAASEGHTEALELLLESGADVNSVDKYGQTALHLAAQERNSKAAKILIESGKCDLSISGQNKNIFSYYGDNPEMMQIIMKNGAEYIPVQKQKSKLSDIAQNIQAAHSEDDLAKREYNKVKDTSLSDAADKLIKDLKSGIYDLDYSSWEDKSKIDNLIISKFTDTKEEQVLEQGLEFANKILEISGIEIKSKDEIISNPNLAYDAIKSLSASEDKQKKINQYIKDTVNQAIENYTSAIAAKPFGNQYGTPKEFIGVIGLNISKQSDEVKKNTVKLLLTELFDAGSMYSAGIQSCNSGMVNKLFNTVPHIFDEEKKKTNEFAFEGFGIDKANYMACVATMLYRDRKKDLAEKILTGSELNRIETQNIASQSYKILKETKKDNDNPDYVFSELIHYGKERNVLEGKDKKIQEFCREIDYERVSNLLYKDLLEKKENNTFKINSEVFETLHFYTDTLEEMKKKEKQLIQKLEGKQKFFIDYLRNEFKQYQSKQLNNQQKKKISESITHCINSIINIDREIDLKTIDTDKLVSDAAREDSCLDKQGFYGYVKIVLGIKLNKQEYAEKSLVNDLRDEFKKYQGEQLNDQQKKAISKGLTNHINNISNIDQEIDLKKIDTDNLVRRAAREDSSLKHGFYSYVKKIFRRCLDVVFANKVILSDAKLLDSFRKNVIEGNEVKRHTLNKSSFTRLR